MMMTKRLIQAMEFPSAGEPAMDQREPQPNVDEVLIEEILKAAGLEALD